MDLANAPFYTSGTFWAIAGVAAAVVIGVATVWVTLRVSDPKRRLLYSMPVVTPLLNKRPGLPADIEVRRKGQDGPLENPHVVTVELTSRGRLDIQRDAFDEGKPLRLDIGAPIIECLEATSTPSDRAVPPYDYDGSALLVGPALIGKRQTIKYSLLVDGLSPRLTPPMQSLSDVDIQTQRPESRRSSALASAASLLLGLAAGMVANDVATFHGGTYTLTASLVSVAVLVTWFWTRWFSRRH